MLRMVLLGLLILLGVGFLVSMELRNPARSTVAVVRPPAQTTAGISDSHGALAKADRLEIAAVSSETPAQPSRVEERISPSEAMGIDSSEPPKVIDHHRHHPRLKKVAAVIPKSKSKGSRNQANYHFRAFKGCRRHSALSAKGVWWFA
ncbi:hypothetical protein ACVWWO_005641 [Bradyrhizobium sp. F1.13.1]